MTSLIRNLLTKTNFVRTNGLTNSIRLCSGKLDPPTHKVNNLEKKFLVWTGKYKTVEEVPSFVSQNVVERARNRMRIRIANYMMATTAVACIIMIISGKQALNKGESVQKQNLEWHKRVKEHDAKEAALAAK